MLVCVTSQTKVYEDEAHLLETDPEELVKNPSRSRDPLGLDLRSWMIPDDPGLV